MKTLILNFIIILRHICHHVKHRKWEPECVHGQLEGCNRNLRPKAAVAKVYTHGKGVAGYRVLVDPNNIG